MSTRDERIAGLTDEQALSVVESLAGEFADIDTPEGTAEQTQALQAVLIAEGETVDVGKAAEADIATAAHAARRLLVIMAQVPEIQPSLDQWLDNPPLQEAAAIPLILAAPVVLTGCIVTLQVAAHVRFQRHTDGSWEFGYDPSKPAPLDKTMAEISKTLANLMRAMLPGG